MKPQIIDVLNIYQWNTPNGCIEERNDFYQVTKDKIDKNSIKF
jgi:hypothetical protein